MIKLKVTEERLKGTRAGVFRKLESSAAVQFEFVARFMIDENGEYLTETQAYEILDELPMSEIGDIMRQLRQAMEEAAVPNGSGLRSAGASSPK